MVTTNSIEKQVTVACVCVCLCVCSPYNDVAKQSELDHYFMQTALPSPWPAASRTQHPPKAPPTAKPMIHVTPATTCEWGGEIAGGM